jgi:hypothetical protein
MASRLNRSSYDFVRRQCRITYECSARRVVCGDGCVSLPKHIPIGLVEILTDRCRYAAVLVVFVSGDLGKSSSKDLG